MIRGLIFDFDGLILNTEEAEYSAWEEIFQLHGAHLPIEDFGLSMGMAAESFDVLGLFERATGQPCDRELVHTRARERFHALLAVETARPGVEDYLRAAKMSGLPVALATSSSRDWAEGHLKRLGLWQYFDVVCTSNDVSRVKPDPELFLLAASRLGLSPQETLVFEDSLNGIRAALAAGCYCVAVPHRLSNFDGHESAHRVIPSMESIPLQALIDEINASLE